MHSTYGDLEELVLGSTGGELDVSGPDRSNSLFVVC